MLQSSRTFRPTLPLSSWKAIYHKTGSGFDTGLAVCVMATGGISFQQNILICPVPSFIKDMNELDEWPARSWVSGVITPHGHQSDR